MYNRKLLLSVLLLLCLLGTGCTDRKSPAGEESAEEDSLAADTLLADTVADLVEEVPETKAVDELFDDFFFNFAGNRRMQMSRIVFPLPIHKDGGTTMLARRQWQYSHFFMGEGFYTILLDNSEQDSLSKNYGLTHASVEKLYLDEGRMKEYSFVRGEEGEWRLTEVSHKPLADHPCASFLQFYQRFSADSAYQVRSLDEFVVMTAPDSDDEDFNEVTGSIMPEQWPTFKPEVIPRGVVYCVNYGQHYSSDKQKVLVVRGVANGLMIEMTFQRKDNDWKLVRFTC
ncbi:MAG: DUF4348 domain-containing protein [Prevotella sp.]|nr:DUF4348 domain-containing protein [Prevotella sp.]